ncbi:hypothetical protein PYCCODRAFT_832887 [Trametes coccinea BRFM310]|uniref:Uncharacterized protein n=1 Tax=Trametes coccinea (strain BRFM310) TaxID=1353009 RepID=A0A1Y2IED3_TRAC3|nr:hypothetical protein PYCCODRAFT_832887 [Trametes coccinea BRFM310]
MSPILQSVPLAPALTTSNDLSPSLPLSIACSPACLLSPRLFARLVLWCTFILSRCLTLTPVCPLSSYPPSHPTPTPTPTPLPPLFSFVVHTCPSPCFCLVLLLRAHACIASNCCSPLVS